MPLLPSRRLPKALQRSISPLSRKVARKLVKKRGKGRVITKGGRFARQWRRVVRIFAGMFTHLKAWLVLLAICAVLVVTLFFLLSPTFAISSIRVSRQDRRIDVEEIQKQLAPQFGKHIFFVSPMLLAREIRMKYPEVASVDVKRSYPNEIHVLISMDEIVAEIILGEPDETETGISEFDEESVSVDGLYRYVTKKGVYLEYPFALESSEDNERLRIHVVDWATKPEHRQPLISIEVLHAMQSAKALMIQSFGSSVPLITLYIRAKEFHVHTFHPGRPEGKEKLTLWFDLASTVLTQINRYRTFLRGIPLGSAEDYVDLRLHDRVVYR